MPTFPTLNYTLPPSPKNLFASFLTQSLTQMDLPVIDLSEYFAASSEGQLGSGRLSELCGEVSRSLKETGALLVRDPRCSAEDNDRFLDMMERYFDCPHEFKLLQERPHLHYQVLIWETQNLNWVLWN